MLEDFHSLEGVQVNVEGYFGSLGWGGGGVVGGGEQKERKKRRKQNRRVKRKLKRRMNNKGEINSEIFFISQVDIESDAHCSLGSL